MFLILDMINKKNYFSINNETGELTVQLKGGETILDRDNGKKSFILSITVYDNYLDGELSNSNQISTTVTVVLEDINDQVPTFPEQIHCEGDTREDDKSNTIVCQDIQATDKDEGVNSELTYSITKVKYYGRNESPKEPFKIVNKNNKTADLEIDNVLLGAWGIYEIYLQVEDHGESPLNDSAVFNITVKDVNDHNPQIESPKNGDFIYLGPNQNLHSKLYKNDQTLLEDFKASDDDDYENGNGRTSMSLVGDEEALKFFQLRPEGNNAAELQLIQLYDSSKFPKYKLILAVTDNGKEKQNQGENTTIFVKFEIEELPPTFNTTSSSVSFKESEEGLSMEELIVEANDPNNDPDDPAKQQAIYYFIIGGDESYFILNSSSRVLTLQKELDYEIKKSYFIYILAKNINSPPSGSEYNPDNPSMQKVIVDVIDVNDETPIFALPTYSKGISSETQIYDVILTLRANDPDTNDNVKYLFVEGSMHISDPSLEPHKKDAFIVRNSVNSSADIILNYSVQTETGYYDFSIMASDKVGHNSTTQVRIYIISKSFQCPFRFQNNRDFIESKQDDIVIIFSETYQYNCSIASINVGIGDNNEVLTNVTDIKLYFIDPEMNEPIDKTIIEQKTNDLKTYKKLIQALKSQGIELQDGSLVDEQDSDNNEIMVYVLSAISGVAVTALIAIVVVYIFRVKSLQNRLDAMSSTKFNNATESTDRTATAQAPGLNLHAVSSNPIWNKPVTQDFDANSVESMDSGLIGVENSPEFFNTNKEENLWDEFQTTNNDDEHNNSNKSEILEGKEKFRYVFEEEIDPFSEI